MHSELLVLLSTCAVHQGLEVARYGIVWPCQLYARTHPKMTSPAHFLAHRPLTHRLIFSVPPSFIMPPPYLWRPGWTGLLLHLQSWRTLCWCGRPASLHHPHWEPELEGLESLQRCRAEDERGQREAWHGITTLPPPHSSVPWCPLRAQLSLIQFHKEGENLL